MTLNAEERVAVFVLSRVVFVDVDVVQRGLLQAEHIDYGAVQDVVGLGEELIEAPTLLLICLQDVGEDGGQEALKTPETRDHVWEKPTKNMIHEHPPDGLTPLFFCLSKGLNFKELELKSDFS